MTNTNNTKLINWIKETVINEYADDISIVALYGSYINGTANPKSDIDCYFIPKTERAYQFATDFILCGIGYDIFPMSWERAENIADLQEVLLPLIGDVEILYSSTAEDLSRFQALQSKLTDNLNDRQFTCSIAARKVTDAWQARQHMLSDSNAASVRKYAGYLIMTLADAVAIYNHTYYHYGLKRQFADLQSIPGLPGQICDEYLRVIQSDITHDILSHCLTMLTAVCDYMDLPIPAKHAVSTHTSENGNDKEAETQTGNENIPAADSADAETSAGRPPQTDYASLATLYEELCSTFNKIYICCDNGDYVLAYLSAVCLQEDLDYAHDHLGAKQYDLFTQFHYGNLNSFRSAAEAIERELVQFITSGGGIIKRYDSFEEFARAAGKPSNTNSL